MVVFERETQTTQKFTRLVYLLPFWKDHKYRKMHISSDSLSATAHVHSGWSHSPVSPEALKMFRPFVQYLLWPKSACSNMLHSNIFQYAWHIWPTRAVCTNHAHGYISSLLQTTVKRAEESFQSPLQLTQRTAAAILQNQFPKSGFLLKKL